MRILAVIGALAIVVGIGAATFFFGGFYSVAATAEDPTVVTWALTQVRNASINRYALEQPPASINDPASVRPAPRRSPRMAAPLVMVGRASLWLKLSEGLHPDPPDLKKVVDQRSPAQLFWIVKNGINMTGMPSFALAGAKDEEIWQIVAFLKKLPTVSEADYKSWTAAP